MKYSLLGQLDVTFLFSEDLQCPAFILLKSLQILVLGLLWYGEVIFKIKKYLRNISLLISVIKLLWNLKICFNCCKIAPKLKATKNINRIYCLENYKYQELSFIFPIQNLLSYLQRFNWLTRDIYKGA